MHSRVKISGATLAELMVVMSISGFFLLLVTAAYQMDAKYQTRVKMADRFQNFSDIVYQSFSQSETFDQYLSQVDAKKAYLVECLKTPCDPNCEKFKEWRPLDWGPIKANLRFDELAKLHQDGSNFEPAKPGIACLPLPAEPGYRGPPQYPLTCTLHSLAQWRSGPGQTMEMRVATEEFVSGYRKVIYHYAPMPELKGGINGTCGANRAVYCKSRGAYLLDVDFRKNQVVCADPNSEVNFR